MSNKKGVLSSSETLERIISALDEKFLQVAIVDEDYSTMFDTLDLMVYACLLNSLEEEKNFTMDFLLPMKEQFAEVYEYFKG